MMMMLGTSSSSQHQHREHDITNIVISLPTPPELSLRVSLYTRAYIPALLYMHIPQYQVGVKARPPHCSPREPHHVDTTCARIMRARGRAQRARACQPAITLLISSVDIYSCSDGLAPIQCSEYRGLNEAHRIIHC